MKHMLRLNSILLMSQNFTFDNKNTYISRKILENYHDIPHLSLDALTKRLNISKGSFKKYYNQLNYESFLDFKDDILFTQVVRKKQFMDRYSLFNKDVQMTFFQQIIKREIDLNLINTISDEIHNTNRIIIIGSETLLVKTLDFQLDLMTFGKTVLTYSLNNIDELILQNDDLIFMMPATGRLFNLSHFEIHKNILQTQNKKILICKDCPTTNNINYILKTYTQNDYYEMHYVYLFYLNLITIQYYERYVQL